MSIKRPFFSIILPTFNRGSLIGLAIRSVLGQTFDDFELVISNGGSTDDTKKVVARFEDERIRYFETRERLNMGENYQNALNQASGEYILFFSDDDALIGTALERLKRVIDGNNADMVIFPLAYYFHEKSQEFGRQIDGNTLAFLPYTRAVSAVESGYALEQMCSHGNISQIPVDVRHVAPFIGNVAYHHSINDKLKTRTSNFFATVPIDIYFIAMVLGLTDRYYLLDEPLLVWSKWSKNSTATFEMTGDRLRQHYENLLKGDTLRHVPLKFALPSNCGTNAVLQAMADLDCQSAGSPADWTNYFIKTYEYLTHFGELGVNTVREFDELDRVLSEQSVEIQIPVKEWLQMQNNSIKARAKKRFRTTFPAAAGVLRRWAKVSRDRQAITVKGGRNGFNNFLECAEYLDKNVDRLADKKD